MTKGFIYNIDVVGNCNLQCPSCPVGNSPELPHPQGVMPLDLFEEIVLKIKRETPISPQIGLFNWAEPLLHPQLPDLLEIANRHHAPASISSNLNLNRNLEEIVRQKPSSFIISISGFFQETYSQTHRRGNIEAVKNNMHRLREIMNKLGSKMQVNVAYHCYMHNLGPEYIKIADLCRKLKFSFSPIWAYLMPAEKNLDLFEGGISDVDKGLIGLLAIPPQQIRAISLRHMTKDCHLRSNRSAINCNGSVPLCCAVYDSRFIIADSFLEHNHEEIQRRKYSHPICNTCMKHGIHVSAIYRGIHDWNKFISQRLGATSVPRELIILGNEDLLKRTLGSFVSSKLLTTKRYLSKSVHRFKQIINTF